MSAALADTFDVVALLAKLAVKPRRITSDSRVVTEGVAFAAYPGARQDGRAFISDAVARGAPAVLWDLDGFTWNAAIPTPNQGVARLRDRLGPIADFIYGSPSQSLWMVGVTGTNGKTSCTQWIAAALDGYGRRAAVIGTLGCGLVDRQLASLNTTPDAAVLQEALAQMKALGAVAVAMEVSSIGLDQGRVNGTHFDVALFTNLSRDHLDYHGTMAAYGAAKAALFDWPGLATAVINLDDDFGRGLADRAGSRRARTLTYSLVQGDIAARSIESSTEGMRLLVATPWGTGELATSLVGTFNASNLLGALGVLLASDVPLADALSALSRVAPPPGRMERFGGTGRPLVVVDYAHTPDALEQVLKALRSAVAPGGNLICVFGAGGDRDPGKRPEMGRVAATLAERVVVTSDNPRGEEPTAIAMAIGAGIRAAGNRHWTLEVDRAAAIRSAIHAARPGDVVLVAGKGHESTQEVRGEKHPFSDARQVADALSSWSEG